MDYMDEWIHCARLLMDYKEDATLWDLLIFMYLLKTGSSIPVDESDDDLNAIYLLHLLGKSPTTIADTLDVNLYAIRTYIISAGFRPWKSDVELDTFAIYSDYLSGIKPDALVRMYAGASTYLVNKIIGEMQNDTTARL
jgi:hypothetical protein